MANLSVAQVSALINAAIIVVQFTLPLALVLSAFAVLKSQETAATWTSASRLIHSSYWPTFLDTDFSITRGVRKRIDAFSWILRISLILLVIAGISTPLGLSEGLQLGAPRQTSFAYVPDLGPMGSGTLDRSTFKYNRLCGNSLPYNCPGVDGGYQSWPNEFGGDESTYDNTTDFIDIRIPENVTEIFKSGTTNTTVSSIFDIQFRTYWQQTTAGTGTYFPILNNEPYTIGGRTTLQSMVLNNRIDLVEGMIVDTISGGVGFRKHTLPSSTPFGSEWEEDLLWIEPVTECIDTNLTIEFEHTPSYLYTRKPHSFLVDNGGMVNLSPDFPFIDENDTQKDPQLYATAYRAAALNNALTAAFFNLTINRPDSGKARLGARYNLSSETQSPYLPLVNQIQVAGLTGMYLPLGLDLFSNRSQNATEPSPITSANFSDINDWSQRFNRNNVVNISTLGIKVGLVYGAPNRPDGLDSQALDPWTNWTQTVMACASVARASIKTVRFFANGTTLSDAQVLNISAKIYENPSNMPVWATERTNLTVRNLTPFWGIVDSKYEDSPALWTRRSDQLYLLAGQGYNTGDLSTGADGNPSGIPLISLSAAYQVGGSITGSGMFDYSGQNSFALTVKWRELSRSPQTAPQIINLIFTDIMANTLLGTKAGNLPSGTNSTAVSGSRQYQNFVQTWEKKIVYDIRYAIPAIILLTLWLPILLVALILWCTSRASIAALKQLINQLSAGRLSTNLLLRTDSPSLPADASSKEWSEKAGSTVIGFSRAKNGENELEFNVPARNEDAVALAIILRDRVRSTPGVSSRGASPKDTALSNVRAEETSSLMR